MQQERNRVIEGMQEWKQKEQMIADLFSLAASRSRYVQKLKLDHLRELRRNLGNNLTKDERIVMRVLRGEISQMERQLYPNLLIRIVVKLSRAINDLRTSSLKKSQDQLPGWKLKVEEAFMPKQKQSVKLQLKAAMRPTLVQKKKVSQRKSMKIRR